MRALKKVIASHQHELRGHRLFEMIERTQSAESLAHMARSLAFWPMMFQDVLRLNVDRIQGSGLERFAEYHQSEDSGHDRWYLEDLEAFSMVPPDLDELFSNSFVPIRDACYALMAEVQRDQSGTQRVALLLALEPTGHVFFESISAAVERVCPELPLRYFARFHLGVEKDHDLFTESTEHDLEKLELGDEERIDAEMMVARVYRSFDEVFSFLADQMDASTRVVHRSGAPRFVSDVRQLGGAPGLATGTGGIAEAALRANRS